MHFSRAVLKEKFQLNMQIREEKIEKLMNEIFDNDILIYNPVPSQFIKHISVLSRFYQRDYKGHCIVITPNLKYIDSRMNNWTTNINEYKTNRVIILNDMNEEIFNMLNSVFNSNVDYTSKDGVEIDCTSYWISTIIFNEAVHDEWYSKFTNAFTRITVTENPIYFYEKYKDPLFGIKCIACVMDTGYYKKLKSGSYFITYEQESISRNNNEIKMRDINGETQIKVNKHKRMAHKMLEMGLFDASYFNAKYSPEIPIENSLISTKLITLFRFIKDVNGQFFYIYIDEDELRILWPILKMRIEGYFDESTWSIKNGRFRNYTEIQINCKFVFDHDKLKRSRDKIIILFMTMIPVIFKGKQSYLISTDAYNKLETYIVADEQIVEEFYTEENVTHRYKAIVVDLQGFSNNNWFYSDNQYDEYYQFLSDTRNRLDEKCNAKAVIEYNNFFILAKTKHKYDIKNIHEVSKFPVEFPFKKEHSEAMFFTSGVEIGSIINYYQFISTKRFRVSEKEGTKNFNHSTDKYLDNISDSEIDEYNNDFIWDNNYQTNQSSPFYLTEFNKFGLNIFYDKYLMDIPGKYIEKVIVKYDELKSDKSVDVYLCLKIPPRMYVAEDERYVGHCIKYQNLEQLKSAIWKRCSSREVNWFENRGDIKITFNLNQDCAQQTSQMLNLTKCSPEKVLETLVQLFYKHYPVVVYSDIKEEEKELELEESEEEEVDLSNSEFLSLYQMKLWFKSKLEFDKFYNVLCLVSKKGRFLTEVFTKTDLEYLNENTDISMFCKYLESQLKHRLDKINLHKIVISFQYYKESQFRYMLYHNNQTLIRSIVITPLRIIYNYELPNDSNRILRNFDSDKFIRVSLRDESEDLKFQNDITKNTDNVYDYFRTIMLHGIYIGYRKYFFLVMTTSQMSSHNAWFISTYIISDKQIVIGADYIREWLGDFKSIKCIGKYAVRIGQVFSSTKEGVLVDKVFIVDDTVRNGYNFTDGVGIISTSLGYKLSSNLGLNTQPSAYQIRFGGAKGVVTVQPHEIVQKYCDCDQNDDVLILRKSLVKFDSPHNMIEILGESRSHDFYLNRQIIMILEGLGIPVATFISIQDSYIKGILHEALKSPTEFVNKHIRPHVLKCTNPLLFIIFNALLEEINQKSRIKVVDGRAAMGVTDEKCVLESNEVFIMFHSDQSELPSNCISYGDYVVPTGVAIVAKNPCMHPGDIRIVKCVDKPDLHYMKDVLVFSQKGDRPKFNECSGSDLDGDIYSLCWHKDLIPLHTFKPYHYNSISSGLNKVNILHKDIVNFFIKHMKTHQLGIIALAHMSFADKYSIFDSKTLKLSELFNRNIDFVKTGSSANISADLFPREYPDYMELSPGYKTNKALGHLWRRSKFNHHLYTCECLDCFYDYCNSLDDAYQLILKGAEPEVSINDTVDSNIRLLLNDYKSDIKILMNKYNVNMEEMLFISKDIDLQKELRMIVNKYRNIYSNRNDYVIDKCSKNVGMFNLVICKKVHNENRKEWKNRAVNNYVNQYKECPFNTAIMIDHTDEKVTDKKIKTSVEEMVENTPSDKTETSPGFTILDHKFILVKADFYKMSTLVNSLTQYRSMLFKDVFNMIILSNVYKIDEIDKIISILQYINSAMDRIDRSGVSIGYAENIKRSSSYLDDVFKFIDVVFNLSDNALFKIAFVVGFDISLFRKIQMTKDQALKTGVQWKYSRVSKERHIIVHGMLDEEDDVEFVDQSEYYGIKLKNKGYSPFELYKDEIKEFILNIFYTPGNYQVMKQWRNQVAYSIYFYPGVFKLNKVPVNIVKSSVKIKDILSSIENGSIEYQFDNVANEMVADKQSIVVRIRYEGKEYLIEKDGSGVVQIKRSKEVLGHLDLVNKNNSYVDNPNTCINKLDYKIEITREKVIVETDQIFIKLSDWIGNINNKDIKSIYTNLIDKNPDMSVLDITHRESLDNCVVEENVWNGKEDSFRYFYVKEWIAEVENLTVFEKNFGMIWNQYIKQ